MNTKKLISQLLPSRAPTCYQDSDFFNKPISKADIAMSLASAPNISYYLISWHLLQDNAAWGPLVSHATRLMKQLAIEQNWDFSKRRKKLIKRFTTTALLEWSGLYQCQQCSGSGVIKAVQSCSLCNGRGKLKFNQKQKEKLCGVGSGNWKRDGDRIYKSMISMIDIWEKEAWQHIHMQLTNESLDTLTKNEVEFSHAVKLSQNAA